MSTIRIRDKLYSLLVIAVVLTVWQLVSYLISTPYFPTVSSIILTFSGLIVSRGFLVDVYYTLSHTFVGFSIASLIGIGLGLVMGTWRSFYKLLKPIIDFLRPIPPPAFIPIAILFLGIGSSMKFFVVAFGSLWPVLINTIDGISDIEPRLIETGKVLGLNKFEVIIKIVFPAASPYIFSGLKIGSHIALIGAIAAEMIAGNHGIGRFVYEAQMTFGITEMYAGIMMIGLLGYFISKLFLSLENRFMDWHKRKESEV